MCELVGVRMRDVYPLTYPKAARKTPYVIFKKPLLDDVASLERDGLGAETAK